MIPRRRPRIVLDTNCVVSALVFQGSRLGWLRTAWQAGSFVPLADRTTVAELLRVMRYGKFKMSANDREDLLSDYVPYLEVVDLAEADVIVPLLRDASDAKFIDLAVRSESDALVIGDRDLLDIRDELPGLRLLTPVEFQAWLERERRSE